MAPTGRNGNGNLVEKKRIVVDVPTIIATVESNADRCGVIGSPEFVALNSNIRVVHLVHANGGTGVVTEKAISDRATVSNIGSVETVSDERLCDFGVAPERDTGDVQLSPRLGGVDETLPVDFDSSESRDADNSGM